MVAAQAYSIGSGVFELEGVRRVRREIELALEHDKTIMPLLVRRARMIPPNGLPREIASLSSRQAFEIRAESWV